jgi:serine/threonine protein kinase
VRRDGRAPGLRAPNLNSYMPSKKPEPAFVTVAEVYAPQGIVGQGATSVVYEVTDSEGNQWALKSLRSDQATATRTKRFLNELYFCQTYSHENVIRVVDHGYTIQEERKCPFYVMPLYASTLRRTMQDGVPHEKVLRYFSDVLNGVEAAHLRSVVHRDLKPENIMHNSLNDKMVVSDFGIAHFNTEAMLATVIKHPHDRMANFQYSAPEQRVHQGTVDHRADIYALGLILNELFTGHILQGTGFTRIRAIAPEFAYLDEIVDRMVQHSPSNRPNSIDDVKLTLIARKNEFIERQQLDKLRSEIVPSTEISHPLVANPPKIVDVDVRNDTLMLFLDKHVPREWEEAFRTPRSMSFVGGTGPDSWRFERIAQVTRASVQLPPHYLQPVTMQPIINSFKGYVEFANAKFKERIERDARIEEENKRKALRERVAEEDKRQKLLRGLKI